MTTSSAVRRARSAVPHEVDVAVVGSGLGGLMAAACLARQGLRVAVFEAHSVAGGCATQFSRGPRDARYNFDVGLHYIGDCGPDGQIPRILRGVGVELAYSEMERDGFDTLVFPDLRFAIPADVVAYRDRLVALFPQERRGIDRYVRLLGSVMRAGDIQARGEIGPRQLLSLAGDAYGLLTNQGRTIGQVFDAFGIRDARLRAVLLGQSGDYGLPPSKVSAVLHLGLAGHYFRGAYYPKGGGQVIADRLAEVIEAHGGSVHLRRPVARIVVEDKRARGLVLEGRAGDPPEEVRAKVVLSNADIKLTLERLVGVEHLPSAWIERTHGFSMAAALFITFLGVRADLRALGMRATNYWQFDDYDVEGLYGELAVDGPIRPRASYITSATLKDPENALHHAPAGVSNVEVMTIVPGDPRRWHVAGEDAERFRYKDNGEYRDVKASIEENLVARLEALFPGSREHIVFRESATPITHRRFTRATDGTGYGLAATPEQFLKGRPGYRGPIAGLYLAGASTRAGHGIVGALMSGEQAAKRVAADLGRAPERRRRPMLGGLARALS